MCLVSENGLRRTNTQCHYSSKKGLSWTMVINFIQYFISSDRENKNMKNFTRTNILNTCTNLSVIWNIFNLKNDVHTQAGENHGIQCCDWVKYGT